MQFVHNTIKKMRNNEKLPACTLETLICFLRLTKTAEIYEAAESNGATVL